MGHHRQLVGNVVRKKVDDRALQRFTAAFRATQPGHVVQHHRQSDERGEIESLKFGRAERATTFAFELHGCFLSAITSKTVIRTTRLRRLSRNASNPMAISRSFSMSGPVT